MTRPSSLLIPALLSIAVGGCAVPAATHRVRAGGVAPVAPADAESKFAAGMTLALQGDMKAALPIFVGIEPAGLDPEERTALARLLANFGAEGSQAARPELDAWTARVLSAYQTYWSRVMMGAVPRELGERQLAESLAPLAGVDSEAGAPIDMDALEPKLAERIRAKGLFSLHGVTSPFREFLLWRRQIDQTYEVELPEGRETVQVAMLEDFSSLGWTGFATGERYHTAGWATPERLYCVRAAYDLESESFRISYLAHEAQHFSDYKRFPDLQGPELEYRAKLVEIAYADATLPELLKAFAEQGSDQRDNPHGYANRRLIHDLARALDLADPADLWRAPPPPASIRAAALGLFHEDSRRLELRATP